MFDFAKKLLFARQLTIEKGSLIILGHRFMMIPAETVAHLLKEGKNIIKPLYCASKENGKLYADVLMKSFKITTTQKLEELMINTFNLAGWGELEIIKNDFKNRIGVAHIKNSVIAMQYGKSKEPVCHTNRGFLAGGACRVHKSEVDCVEIKCIATGNAYCEFISAPKETLKKMYKDLVSKQI